MARTINPIQRLKVKEGLLQGKSGSAALISAGYSKATANHHIHEIPVFKSVVKEIEAELNDAEVIERLKRILKLKLQLEEKVFEDAQHERNKKMRLQILNKTKDNIAEITKTLRLVEGQSTENIKINEVERQSRLDRIKERLSISN